MLDTQSPPQPSRPSARRWLIAAVVVALLAAIAAHVSTRDEDLAYFRSLSAPILAAALFLQFLSQLFFNAALLLPLQTYVSRLGFWEFFLVRTGGVVAGAAVPVAGGVAVRLAYLRRHGLAYLDFTWATLLANVLALVAAAALAVFATAILWITAGTPPALVLGLTAGIAAISLASLAACQRLPRLASHRRFEKWPWLSRLSGYQASRRTMTSVFTLSLIRHCLNFATFGLLYQSLSRLPGDFLTGGLVYALTSPIRIVTVTPGNLGINEWVVAIVGKAVAFDVTSGLIVALVFRGITLLAQGLGVVLGWAWLTFGSKP